MFRIITVLALFLASGILAPGILAQEPPPTPDVGDTFFEKIAVEIVNVEVYVTDEDGNPVSGLTRDDFVVTEDGRPVEVVNFYRVASGQESEDPVLVQSIDPVEPMEIAGTTMEKVEPGIPAKAEKSSVPDSQRLHLIIYVDNYNIHPLNRNRVFGRLREFLRETVKPGDEVMLASYDRSVDVRHPFTGDAGNINRALMELEDHSGSAVQRESERSNTIKAIYEAKSLLQAQLRAKEFSENWHYETESALDGISEMVDSLAGLPGRKMLLHVSDGLPMIPGQDLYQAIQQRFADVSAMGQGFSRDMSRRYMHIISKANSNRTSFYTIDAGGLRVQSGMGAENAAVNSPHVVSSAIDSVRRKNLQRPLLLMAERTGGQSVMNTNNVIHGLRRFARDFGNYYSLGYQAPYSDRGRYHKIEVRLKDKVRGRKVRHRDGYRDKSIEAQVTDGVTSFLVHGYQTNPHGATIELGPQGPPDKDGFVNVAIRVRIPMNKLVLLPKGGFHIGRVRLYFGAADLDGRKAPLSEIPLELRIPESSIEMALKDDVTRVINATMRPGTQKLVIAVRDEVSEERSVIGRSVRVGSG